MDFKAFETTTQLIQSSNYLHYSKEGTLGYQPELLEIHYYSTKFRMWNLNSGVTINVYFQTEEIDQVLCWICFKFDFQAIRNVS